MRLTVRSHRRVELDVDIKIYSRTNGLLLGKAVEISEGGISAILKIEVPLNEVVHLEFKVPPGFVAVRALVRHRRAFRYGFQFFEPEPEVRELINRTCEQLVPYTPAFLRK